MTVTQLKPRFTIGGSDAASAACVFWTGEIRNGYGLMYLGRDGRGRRIRMYAHRALYLVFRGPIPPGHLLHHVCGQRRCVQPAHLVPVTPREHESAHGSVRLAIAAAVAERRARTHCPAGHAYDAANTYIDPGGARRCRACNRDAMRRRASRT